MDNEKTSIQFAEDFSQRFVNQYLNMMKVYENNGFYNPIYANNAMKRFNTYSNRPTEQNLIQWLNNPTVHEKELRSCSNFLYNSIMSYQRSAAHFASILNFDYELIPINPPSVDSDKKTIELYQRQKRVNNDWLRKFKVKEQFGNTTYDILRDGAKYYYLRNSDECNYLQPMPDDYVYLNGRTDVNGYTYALNMSFFYQFPESMAGFAPEFVDWYNEFIDRKNILNEKANPYRIMPIEKAVVFKFDDSRPESIPPLSGGFKDAISIQDYKDLIRLNLELQTYQMIYLQAPLDADGKPTISAQEIINYTAVVQSLIPHGTGVISAPMEVHDIKFDHSVNIDNMTGKGEQQLFSSIGVAGGLFGQDTKSAVGLKLSVQADYNFVERLYNQYERFLNFQLSMIDGKFGFKVKFLRRNAFFLEEDKTATMSYAQTTGDISRLLSSWGYEPYEHESKMIDNHLSIMYTLTRPLQSPFQSSGGGDATGRPTSESQGKGISDSNDATRSGGYNDGKFSTNLCVCCGLTYETEPIDSIFCSEKCKEEFLAKEVK